jgi:ribulose-5-phosphate 4-epimerase/fuculose-1-phosphate aldolase
MSLEELKRDVAIGNRILSITGLAAGVRAAMGHVSCRDSRNPERFVVKGRGYAIDVLSRMLPENMVVCDLDGRLIQGPAGIAQCNEVKIHSCIYKARPDVQSVVHVHPPYSVILTLRGITIRPVVLEGVRVVRKPLPVYPHTALVTSEDQGRTLACMLGDAPAIHLLGHGAVSVGSSIEEAVTRMLHLEHQARMNFHAQSLPGEGPVEIPDELIDEFLRWKPQSEPHFQEALERTGPVPHLGGMWADLLARAEADIAACAPSTRTNHQD